LDRLRWGGSGPGEADEIKASTSKDKVIQNVNLKRANNPEKGLNIAKKKTQRGENTKKE